MSVLGHVGGSFAVRDVVMASKLGLGKGMVQ